MKQCGSNTDSIDSFLGELRQGVPVRTALTSPTIPKAARLFVEHTFTVIDSGNLCAITSAFTFGREDLLPDAFRRNVDKLDVEAGGQLADFKYYLERHIALNGDEHRPMARRLIQTLYGCEPRQCKKNKQVSHDCSGCEGLGILSTIRTVNTMGTVTYISVMATI